MSKSKRADAESNAKFPVFESMQMAAPAIGVPLSRLRLANRTGCPVQLGGRVNTQEMLRWFLTEESADGTVDWNVRLKKALAERAELRLSKEQGLICDRP